MNRSLPRTSQTALNLSRYTRARDSIFRRPPLVLVLSTPKSAATLELPFTPKGPAHQNEPKTQIIAGRRVGPKNVLNEIFERGGRTILKEFFERGPLFILVDLYHFSRIIFTSVA